MKIELFTFNKRYNSTKKPNTGEGTEKEVVLKKTTSFYNPTFILSTLGDWNYIRWDSRYYYVDDINLNREGLYEYSCAIDVLATYKSNILNTSAFVLFSTSSYDTSIVDNRLSSKDDVIVNTTVQSITGLGSPLYVVTYIGEQGSSNPTVALTQSQLVTVMNAIQSNAFAELFKDPNNAISKILTDTGSCITSCIYNPVCVTDGTKSVVLAGGYSTGVSGSGVLKNYEKYYTMNIPFNFGENDFRNRSQFSSLSIYLPGYGWQQLNVDNLIGHTSLVVKVCIDSTVGEITYFIDNETKCTCNIGSALQVSTTTQGNLGSFVSNAVGAVGSAFTGYIPGAVVSGFNAITSLMQNYPGSVGGMGGSSSFNAEETIILCMKSHDTNIEPSSMASVCGRPLNQVKTLSSLSGYVQTYNASVGVKNNQIAQQINSLLDGGVYLE